MEAKQLNRIIFQDHKSYKHISDEEKEKAFFLFNRVIARAYPTNANALNHKDIDKASAMDVWFNLFSKRFTTIPNWTQVPWWNLKMKKSDSVLKGFSDIDKAILSCYPDVIEEVKKNIKDSKKKVEDLKVKKLKKK